MNRKTKAINFLESGSLSLRKFDRIVFFLSSQLNGMWGLWSLLSFLGSDKIK